MITMKKLTKLVGVLALGVTACSDQPISETGFHENVPGSFEYFVAKHTQCANVSSDGTRCDYSYDDADRLTIASCQYVYVDISYDDLTRRTSFDDLVSSDSQENVEVFTLEDGFLKNVQRSSSFENRESTETTFSYVRDASHQLTRIDMAGEYVGSREYQYDQDSGLLSKIEFVGDHTQQKPGSELSDFEFDWNSDGLLAEVRTTDLDGQARSTSFGYDSDQRLVSSEAVAHDGSIVTTEHLYDCEPTD